ncbi:MAG: hypothetical protein AAGI07_06520 [Bacteroidota bacterium]
MKNFFLKLLILHCLFYLGCKEETDPNPDNQNIGCDGDPSGTNCRTFFIPAGAEIEYSSNTQIVATDSVVIEGDILIDPSEGGNFSITCTDGNVVIAGKIRVKENNPANGRLGRKATLNSKAQDGFDLNITAQGSGNIVLRKGATLFSGKGQDAADESIITLTGLYIGELGGNGGLINLNAPNGKVILPDLSNDPSPDEVFVLGNGGRGAIVIIEDGVDVSAIDKVIVRGGLGGNAGELITDAQEIVNAPALNDMDTYPELIHGGKGGDGGNVFSEADIELYGLSEIQLHGGDGGNGSLRGGDGGLAYFNQTVDVVLDIIPEIIGKNVPEVYCYGGNGGDIFPSPLPLKEVFAGYGGSFFGEAMNGWAGGRNSDGKLFRDGADGGNILGQGGKGGDVRSGVNAYKAYGGDGGNSKAARIEIVKLFQDERIVESDFNDLSSIIFGLGAGSGGKGFSDCDKCLGGDGGDAGKATGYGGDGGSVLGNSVESFGGNGGDIWSIYRDDPGHGGNGNPAGKAGKQPSVGLKSSGGNGGTGIQNGKFGETLYIEPEMPIVPQDGETCGSGSGEDCEDNNLPPNNEDIDCSQGFSYKWDAFRAGPSGKSERTVTIIGQPVENSDVCGTCWECEVTTTEKKTTPDGKVTSTSNTDVVDCKFQTFHLSPDCDPETGQIFRLYGSSSITYDDRYYGTVTKSFTGCYGTLEWADFGVCCQGSDGRFSYWGGKTCP